MRNCPLLFLLVTLGCAKSTLSNVVTPTATLRDEPHRVAAVAGASQRNSDDIAPARTARDGLPKNGPPNSAQYSNTVESPPGIARNLAQPRTNRASIPSKQPGYPANSTQSATTRPVAASKQPAAASTFVAGSGVFKPGMQDDGSMVVAADGQATAFQLSAPLFPCGYDMHSEYAGAKHDHARLRALIARTTIDFDFFLAHCPEYYPMMKRPRPGQPLTEQERLTNFIQADNCRFDPYYSKGYWIPEAIELVDVCAVTLGGDWHVPTELELNQMSRSQRQLLVYPALPKGVSLGRMHELSVYVRRNQGNLAIGNLGDGFIRDFTPPGLFPGQARPAAHAPAGHYEGAVSLRCLRAPASPTPAHPPSATCSPSAKGGKTSRADAAINEVADPKTSPERQEFERRLAFRLKEFESFATNSAISVHHGRVFGDQCRRAAESLSDVERDLRAIDRGHLVLPSWKEPLGSPAVIRFRTTAVKLMPFLQRRLAETKEIVDYCAAHSNIPPCRSTVIAPQQEQLAAYREAERNLRVILGMR